VDGGAPQDWFDEILTKYPRIAIAGGPRTGKSTLSNRVQDRRVIHTDDFMRMDWSECSRVVCAIVNEIKGPVCVEGVRVPHAMRKGMQVDVVVWLDSPLVPLKEGQRKMRDGVLSVMDAVRQTMNAAWIFAPVGQLRRAIRSDR
jgi:hypothetical protein